MDIAEQAFGLPRNGRSGRGAGGIGGLLAVDEVSGSEAGEYVFFYDANGNVGQVLDWSTGTIKAHYEYDPFGDLTRTTGSYRNINSFRFSTKYRDSDTSLYYYGFRYFSPSMGRWLNRDPINDLGDLMTGGIHHVVESVHFAHTGISATEAFLYGDLTQSDLLQLIMGVAGPNPYVYGFNNSQSWVDIDGRVAVPLSGVGDGTGRNHGRGVSAASTGVIALPKLLGGGATAGKVLPPKFPSYF